MTSEPIKIPKNPFTGQDHWAYRLLACPQDQLVRQRQLTSAMRRWPSAILYPEQLFTNPFEHQARIPDKEQHIRTHRTLMFRLWAVWFTGGASGYDVKIRSHSFEKVRMRPYVMEGGQGRSSHVPRTIMRWDMAQPNQIIRLVGDRSIYNAEAIKMHQFLPWLIKDSAEEQNFNMNMLFGDREGAYSFGQAMLNRMGTMFPDDTLLRGRDRISIYDSLK